MDQKEPFPIAIAVVLVTTFLILTALAGFFLFGIKR